MFRVAITALLLAGSLAAEGFKERFTASLIRPYGPSRTRTTFLTVGIDAVTSDAEVETLRKLMATEGFPAVKKRLEDAEMGALFTTGSLAVPLCFVRVEAKPEGGGRRIIGLAARRIAFFETWHQTRSLEYPWSVVILDVDAKGKGQGQLMEAAKIEVGETGRVEVTYSTRTPAKLINVRLLKN